MAKFRNQFLEAIDDIEAKAAKAGISKTELAHQAGMSRNAFSRWRRQPPETILLVERMQNIVAAKRKA